MRRRPARGPQPPPTAAAVRQESPDSAVFPQVAGPT